MNSQVERGTGDLVVRAVTAIMAAVVGLTFLFGFGNVLRPWGLDWAHGLGGTTGRSSGRSLDPRTHHLTTT